MSVEEIFKCEKVTEQYIYMSANAEATGANPVEAPKTFFSDYFPIA